MADSGSDVPCAYPYDSGPHPLPLFDPGPFTDDLPLPVEFAAGNFDGIDFNFEDLDLDLDLDLFLPSDPENFALDGHGSDPDPNHQSLALEEVRVLNSESSEIQCSDLRNGLSQELGVHGCDVVIKPSDSFCGGQIHIWGDSRVLNSQSPESVSCDRGPESSQGSGNCGSGVSEAHSSGSVPSSPDLPVKSSSSADVGPTVVKSKETVLKRKKGREEGDAESKNGKSRKETTMGGPNPPQDEVEDKRNVRLMRNRESAQLSRQRKKIYVEELEDKVRSMHSTIQDMNNRISYIVAENVTLRQQLGGRGMCSPPAVGMYPHPPMAYPWAPYATIPQGAAPVPLVPIPRLKTQQPVSAAKTKRSDNKKKGSKTKKVASVSLLGLLFFMLLFGGLVPMVSIRFGGVGNKAFGSGRSFYDLHRGEVLTVSDNVNGSKQTDGFGHSGNASEPLVASLYVPRNDKLVKIDGNLIIHSVLATDKAMAFNKANNRETGLAIPGKVPCYDGRSNNDRHPHVYNNPPKPKKALPSGSADRFRSPTKSSAADGKLQQWFLEGLAGPMLSSGMCTEVFQFDIAPASAPGGGIIPVSSVPNITAERRPNTTELKRGRNRRALQNLPIPLPGSSLNITNEHSEMNPPNGSVKGNQSHSSVVVSVLVDPREGSDSESDHVIRPNSLSRIFVVVLLDSVKYVTYSCMLPIVGSGPHLVTN